MAQHLQDMRDAINLDPALTKNLVLDDTETTWFAEKQLLIVDFLRLWAEGHNVAMQDLIREQPHSRTFNILGRVVTNLTGMTSNKAYLEAASASTLQLIDAHVQFAIEMLQGPCVENQEFILQKSELVAQVKNIIAMTHIQVSTSMEEAMTPIPGRLTLASHRGVEVYTELLAGSCRLLLAITEGRGCDEVVRRVLMDNISFELYSEHIMFIHGWVEGLEHDIFHFPINAKESWVLKTPAFRVQQMAKKFQTRIKRYLETHKATVEAALLDSTRKATMDEKLILIGNRAALKWKILNPRTYMASLGQPDSMKQHLLQAGYDFLNIFMQLSAGDEELRLQIDPNDKKNTNKNRDFFKPYAKAYNFLCGHMARVEFKWNGKLDLLFFPIPAGANSLSEASKQKFEAAVSLGTYEERMHAFLHESEELVQEMSTLAALSKDWWFPVLQKNIRKLRQLALLLACLLNLLLALSIKGPGGDGIVGHASEISTRNVQSAALRYVLLGALFVVYSALIAYQWLVRVSLINERVFHEHLEAGGKITNIVAVCKDVKSQMLAQCYGEDHGEDKFQLDLTVAAEDVVSGTTGAMDFVADDDGEMDEELLGSLKGCAVWMQMTIQGVSDKAGKLTLVRLAVPLLQQLIVCFAICVIVYVAIGWDAPWLAILYLLGASLAIKGFYKHAEIVESAKEPSYADLKFRVLYRALAEKDTLVPCVMFAIVCSSFGKGQYYMASLLLLETMFLSPRLLNVTAAVSRPFWDIVHTFGLIICVVFIFTAFGMHRYGEIVEHVDDGLAQDGQNIDPVGSFSMCPNLGICFMEFMDSGMRSGDIVDATFDELTYQEGIASYAWRVVYGLAFFIILGVILFDIVTGIIIDTFGSLREETSERLELLKNRALMSDLDRSDCEEAGIDFDNLRQNDQQLWNYVSLILYLSTKDEDDFTGAESAIFKAIQEKDTSWLPEKTCWAMQLKNATDESSEDSLTQAKDEILKTVASMNDALANQLAALTKKTESQLRTFARRLERRTNPRSDGSTQHPGRRGDDDDDDDDDDSHGGNDRGHGASHAGGSTKQMVDKAELERAHARAEQKTHELEAARAEQEQTQAELQALRAENERLKAAASQADDARAESSVGETEEPTPGEASAPESEPESADKADEESAEETQQTADEE